MLFSPPLKRGINFAKIRGFKDTDYKCDHKIEELLMSYAAVIDAGMSRLVRSGKTVSKKNAVAFDIEKYGHAIWGINPMAIPGMSTGSVLQLIGELGHNFVDKFDTPEKFCKW